MTILPEMICHTNWGTPSSTVVALMSREKTITEAARLPAMSTGRSQFILFLSWLTSTSEPPIITGSNGRTQGAATVRTPAMKESMSKNTVIVSCV